MKNDYRQVRVDAIKIMTKAICASVGPKPGCLCNDDNSRCHAVVLYNDFAIAALLGLEKAGFVLVPSSPSIVVAVAEALQEAKDAVP